MSTQQIIESWESGVEPYNATTKHKKPKVDRFGKPISRHFTTQGFPRLRLYREMQKNKISGA